MDKAGVQIGYTARERLVSQWRATWWRRHVAVSSLLASALLVVIVYFTASGTYIYEIDQALLAAIGAIGLNLLTGYAGQVSLGNSAFLGIGAYSAVLAGNFPFPVAVIVAAVVCAVVGLVVGLPALRLRGMYLIFSTLALDYIASFVFERYDTDHGSGAGHYVASPQIGGLVIQSGQTWLIFLAIVVFVQALLVWNMVRGRPGRSWAAIQVNEGAAAVTGINVTSAKLTAFMASSAMVGVAGALGAYFLQAVSGDYYTVELSISYVAMILIGGLESIVGSIAGAFIVTLIPFALSDMPGLGGGAGGTSYISRQLPYIQNAIYGLAILAFLYFRPAGIASLLGRTGPGTRRSALDDGGDTSVTSGQDLAGEGKR